MANHQVRIRADIISDPEIGTQYLIDIDAPSTVQINDTVEFLYTNEGSGSGTVRVMGLNGFNDNGTIALTKGNSELRTATTITNDSMSVTINYNGTTTLNINIISNVDTLPDPWLFESVGSAAPGVSVISNLVQITGISTGVNIFTIGGSGDFEINMNGVWRTSWTILPNQSVRFRTTSSSVYGANKQVTFVIGDRNGIWSVRTVADPNSGEIIPFPVLAGNADIRLKQLGDFFGRPNWAQTTLGDYVKSPNGVYVPAITQNSLIPTSKPLKLGNFRGSATTLYWTQTPADKMALADNTFTGGTLELTWRSILDLGAVDSDFDVGFNPSMRDNMQYKYDLAVTQGSGVVQWAGNSTWSNAQLTVLRYTYNSTQPETSVKGTMTISARHKLYQEYSITTSCNFEFFIYQ